MVHTDPELSSLNYVLLTAGQSLARNRQRAWDRTRGTQSIVLETGLD